MDVRLRGHHLLCLLGYRGMGYSADFSANMSQVYNQLREQPETKIILVDGPDDLCAHYPSAAHSHCRNPSVEAHDGAVLQRLGLQTGQSLTWSSVLERVKSSMVPEDIAGICVACPWRSYGVCEAGIRTIHQGNPLPPLPKTITQ